MKRLSRLLYVACAAISCSLALYAEEDNPLIKRLNELAAMPLDQLKANIKEVTPIVKALNGGTSEGNIGSEAFSDAQVQSPEVQAAITNFNSAVRGKLEPTKIASKKA